MSSDTSGKPTITGLVLTYNGERLLGKCLESLAFCDAVIVVDSFSSDATESIAREHGATFVQHPWSGALPQFEYALGLVKTDWVVSLDQDEICSEPLRDAILAALPVACLVASIMHANDIRDIAHDREAGITTLAMLLGRRKALYLYAALCVGAYGVLLLLAAFGVLPLSGLLPFVLAPGLWRTLRTLGTRPLPESELVSLDGVSARHHFLFGLLLIAGILLPRGLELAQGLIRGIFA